MGPLMGDTAVTRHGCRGYATPGRFTTPRYRVYVNNVWYLNYSDRSACRMTGMTRFATFWVEHGVIQARSMSCVSMNRCTVCSATISSASTSERSLS